MSSPIGRKLCLLLAFAFVACAPPVRAAGPPSQLPAARREALEAAARDPKLSHWQRILMGKLARGVPPAEVAQPSARSAAERPPQVEDAANGRWNEIPPSGIANHTAIYDPIRDRMIVFGGLDGAQRNELWALTLSGTPKWSALSPSGNRPPARDGHTAIYDSVRQRMIVYGGYDGENYLNDAWALTLSGSPAWSEILPAGTAPAGFEGNAAIYDTPRDRMVLFAGSDGGTYALTLSGTPTWSALTPSGTPPAILYGYSAIYDPIRQRMVVHGGVGGGTEHNEVWGLSLTGSPVWSMISTAGTPPAPRFGHTASYDPVVDRMIVFAGSGPSQLRNDVYSLSLSGTPTWTLLTPAGGPPVSRNYHSAIRDPVRNRMVIFGGYDAEQPYRDDAWALALSGSPAWSRLVPAGPRARTGHSEIYDPVRDRLVICGGSYDAGNHIDAWAFGMSSETWTLMLPADLEPSGRFSHTAIYDPVRNRMLMFGGYDTDVRNDVWALTMGDEPLWLPITTAGIKPSARYEHTAVYDALRDRMLVFAGYDTTYLNDVWALSLSGTPTWSKLLPTGTPPPPISNHAAIYDPIRDRMIVFDGANDSLHHELWQLTLAGTPGWSTITAPSVPPARLGHTATYDETRDRMIVFGGTDTLGTMFDDVWSLRLTGSPQWTELFPTAPNPTGRFEHTATFDPVRDRMLVFGGANYTGTNGIFWTLKWNFHTNEVPVTSAAVPLVLEAPRPNPVRVDTRLHYALARAGRVSLDLFDLQGRRCRRLASGVQTAGNHVATFDRRDDRGRLLAAGVYVVRLRTPEGARTTRLVLLP